MAKKPPAQFATDDPGINYSAMMQPGAGAGGGGVAAPGNGSAALVPTPGNIGACKNTHLATCKPLPPILIWGLNIVYTFPAQMHPEMLDNPAAAQGFRTKPRARGGRAAAKGDGRGKSRGGATKKKFKPRGGWGAFHARKNRG